MIKILNFIFKRLYPVKYARYIGVKIGDNVVIGAYSVVSKDIPSDSVAVGIPARVIKTTNDYIKKSVLIGDNTKSMSLEDKKIFYQRKNGK